MSVPKLSSEMCEKRSRIAAARYGVNAMPFRFIGNTIEEANSDVAVELKSVGRLPETDKSAISLINANLPEGATPLAADDVYIHYLEAANTNYIADRSMHLSQSTLQNIAKDAKTGVSFMNSHRTGGLSSPAELPFGRSFAGQYQEVLDNNKDPIRRTVIGIYMVRGTNPNGQNGPSTDDLDKGMRSGTIFDVSVGLRGGDYICNVCGNDLNGQDDEGDYLCKHYPGTHYNMTKEEVAEMKQSYPQNTKGLASYTLQDAGLGEISAVYDGAVPGAGVKKVMSLSKAADISKQEFKDFIHEAFEHYGSLLPFDIKEVITLKEEDDCQDFNPCDTIESNGEDFMKTPNTEETPPQEELQTAPPAPEATPAPQVDLKSKHERAARYFVSDQLSNNRILPAQKESLTALYVACAEHGIEDELEAFVTNTPSHSLTQDVIPPTEANGFKTVVRSEQEQDASLKAAAEQARQFASQSNTELEA